MKDNIDSNPACISRKYDSSKYKSNSGPLKESRIPDNNIISASNDKVISYYYLDIKDMNQKQLDYFKKYAKFEKMSVQDYINWLYLNKDKLTGYNKFMWHTHFINGYDIKQSDIPRNSKVNADYEEKRRIDNSILDKLKGTWR